MNQPAANADRAGALRTLASELTRVKTRALGPVGSVVKTGLTALTNAKAPNAARYQALARKISTAQATIRNQAVVTPDSFLVQGQIVDETGAPRTDCSLVVADAGQAVSSKIGPQKANADGFASVLLRAAEFPGVVNGSEPVFVSVLDGQGRQVYAPSTAVAAKSGLAITFRAVVPKESTPA